VCIKRQALFYTVVTQLFTTTLMPSPAGQDSALLSGFYREAQISSVVSILPHTTGLAGGTSGFTSDSGSLGTRELSLGTKC
jgi:hypothetical protein